MNMRERCTPKLMNTILLKATGAFVKIDHVSGHKARLNTNRRIHFVHTILWVEWKPLTPLLLVTKPFLLYLFNVS